MFDNKFQAKAELNGVVRRYVAPALRGEMERLLFNSPSPASAVCAYGEMDADVFEAFLPASQPASQSGNMSPMHLRSVHFESAQFYPPTPNPGHALNINVYLQYTRALRK